jgi:hypothetical protein
MDGAPGASANDPREDAMAYAIIESLDVDKFREILNQAGSYGAKARLPGSGPGMMYSLMETHFGERAAVSEKLEHQSLKRRSEVLSEPPASSDLASADFANAVAPELRVFFSERLVSVLTTRRTSPQTLIAVFDELNAMPHVAIKDPSTLAEGQIRDMIIMDELLEATKKARAKARDAFGRNPWYRQHLNNFAIVVDRRDDVEEDGSVIQDGCAICGVVKTECMNQAKHFGTRGESPPDAKCLWCRAAFGNSYDAEHILQLHVAAKHAATRQSPKRNRFMVSPEPPASASTAASSDFASSDFASFSERLVQVLTTRRTSPRALIAVFDELNAMPHVPIKAPSTLGERHIRDMILMDELLEATKNAHAKEKQAFERTPWARQHSSNCGALSDAAAIFKFDEDTVTPDGCAICGVAKTECMNQAEHFGTRGESPPDAKCPSCKMGFWNRYDSEHQLQLHVAQRHAAKQK